MPRPAKSKDPHALKEPVLHPQRFRTSFWPSTAATPQPHLSFALAMRAWTCHLPSLSLSFLMCKPVLMKSTLFVSTLQNHLVQCLPRAGIPLELHGGQLLLDHSLVPHHLIGPLSVLLTALVLRKFSLITNWNLPPYTFYHWT